MDLRERILEYSGSEGLEEIIRAAFSAQMRNIWTCMPVTLSEDSDGKSAKLKFNIKSQERDEKGQIKHVELPELSEVPIQFASGGGTTTTFPLKKGDEGLVVFASRAPGAWRQNGGVQQAVDAGSHALSGGFLIPGIRSKPRDLKEINTDATETRSDDGKHRVSLHPKDGTKTSIENGKHVVTWHPDNGMTASVDNGKHTFGINPSSGINMKSAMSIAAEAANGFAFKGALAVDGKVTSTQSIGAPALQGVLGGFTGAAVAVALTLGVWAWSGAQSPSEGFQQVRYALAVQVP